MFTSRARLYLSKVKKVITQIEEDINLDEVYVPKGSQNAICLIVSYTRKC